MSLSYKVILFYKYLQIFDTEAVVSEIKKNSESLSLLGRVLIAREGFNGSLAGPPRNIDEFIQFVELNLGFCNVDWKTSYIEASDAPFLDLNVRIVSEIVSSGRDINDTVSELSFSSNSFGGLDGTGVHLKAKDFHDAIRTTEREKIVVDVRNEFEYDIGHFDGAVGLKTFTYSETFKALDALFNLRDDQSKEMPAIYMYCTGGIRCEKASLYLCSKGLKEVYQLEGGIHRYLETFPDGGLFRGKNFVFDSRVAVAPSLSSPSIQSRGDEIIHPELSTREAETYQVVPTSVSTRSSVIGRCVDCDTPHDVYSGHVMCTVCRMPVLVCPSCVDSNPHPNEYYCSRHRDLKGVYLTVLCRYSLAELRVQEGCLWEMERALQGDSRRKQKRTMLRKQRERVAAAATAAVLANTTSNEDKNYRATSDCGACVGGLSPNIVTAEFSSNPKTKGNWGFWKS